MSFRCLYAFISVYASTAFTWEVPGSNPSLGRYLFCFNTMWRPNVLEYRLFKQSASENHFLPGAIENFPDMLSDCTVDMRDFRPQLPGFPLDMWGLRFESQCGQVFVCTPSVFCVCNACVIGVSLVCEVVGLRPEGVYKWIWLVNRFWLTVPCRDLSVAYGFKRPAQCW